MSRSVGELKKVLDEFGDECAVYSEDNTLYVREDGRWHPADELCGEESFDEEEGEEIERGGVSDTLPLFDEREERC